MSYENLNVILCQQGPSEWFDSRVGMLASSRIAGAIRKARRESTGDLECGKNLRIDLAVERITRKPAESNVGVQPCGTNPHGFAGFVLCPQASSSRCEGRRCR